tara:strand:- start:96 stop:290 length:195 start_codon:yes stop_codon:yes gene_type:complete
VERGGEGAGQLVRVGGVRVRVRVRVVERGGDGAGQLVRVRVRVRVRVNPNHEEAAQVSCGSPSM